MLRDIVELKIKMLKLRAIFSVEFCYNLATIAKSIYSFIYLFIYLSIYLFIYLFHFIYKY